MKTFSLKSIPWRELLEKEKQVIQSMSDFLKQLWTKITEDEILFLASGMAFNVLLCLIPILLLWIYVLGIWFPSSDTIWFMDQILERAFPDQPYALAIRQGISSILAEIAINRKSFG